MACSSVRVTPYLHRCIGRRVALGDYHDLHKYSVTDYTFWQDLWEYVGIIYSVPPEKVCAPPSIA